MPDEQYMVLLDEPEQVNRLVRLLQEDTYRMIGQLHVATRTLVDPNVAGSKRQRAEKAVRAIPEQLERADRTRQALIDSLNER